MALRKTMCTFGHYRVNRVNRVPTLNLFQPGQLGEAVEERCHGYEHVMAPHGTEGRGAPRGHQPHGGGGALLAAGGEEEREERRREEENTVCCTFICLLLFLFVYLFCLWETSTGSCQLEKSIFNLAGCRSHCYSIDLSVDLLCQSVAL